MKPHPLLLATAILVCASLDARAGKVKTWHHHRPADQEKAELKQVVVSSEGTLRLSRKLRALARLDATHVWAVAEDRAGNLYAATGEEGKVYRVKPDGKAEVVFASEQSQVLSLTVDSKGETVHAGTGPEAAIVRIDAGGAKKLCVLPESYVWALAHDPGGEAIYAATGPHGRVYRVTPDGRASVFFETKQDHVLCLAVAADGSVYAGTDKTGRIYRIDARGRGFVVYQAPQAEVRTLLLAGEVLYAGTSATKKRGSAGRDVEAGGRRAARQEADPPVRVVSRGGDKGAATAANEPSGEKSKETKESASSGSKAPAPPAPVAGENSVYRITPDGGVREVFRGKVLVLSLARQGGRLLVGTGMHGELYEVDEATREKSALARLDHGQLLGLCRRKDGSLVVAAGDPGKLYALDDRFVHQGTVVSDVLDAKLPSRWGALRWRAEVPAKTAVSIAARSGNVAEPDETWSDWTSEETDGEAATVRAPAARYLQYRITLTTEDPQVSPAVKSLSIRHASVNQAPEVTKVEVPNLQEGAAKGAKKLEFKWSATDSNEDELRFKLFVKKDGWEQWVRLEDDLEKTEYEWDTTTTPSGVYRLKVVASDRVDNAEGEALTGERISEPFVVCHTPPAVMVKTTALEEGRMGIEATAASPLARLTAASYSLNGKKWVNVFPKDGLFDGKREAFAFRTEALEPGAYVLVLKVQDAAGNTGSGDVVFTVPRK
jgi:sugar lactone lactonase YvrE